MDVEGIAKQIVEKIEAANVGFDFACDADREEAEAIVSAELRAAVGANVGAAALKPFGVWEDVGVNTALETGMETTHTIRVKTSDIRRVRVALAVGADVRAGGTLPEKSADTSKD